MRGSIARSAGTARKIRPITGIFARAAEQASDTIRDLPDGTKTTAFVAFENGKDFRCFVRGDDGGWFKWKGWQAEFEEVQKEILKGVEYGNSNRCREAQADEADA